MLDYWKEILLGLATIIGGGNLLKLFFYKHESKSMEIDNQGKEIDNKGKDMNTNSIFIDQSKEMLALWEDQMNKQLAFMEKQQEAKNRFYESEIARVVASNEEKKTQLAEKDKVIAERDAAIARLTADLADRDKTIAVQKERECLRSECNKRMGSEEGSLNSFPIVP